MPLNPSFSYLNEWEFLIKNHRMYIKMFGIYCNSWTHFSLYIFRSVIAWNTPLLLLMASLCVRPYTTSKCEKAFLSPKCYGWIYCQTAVNDTLTNPHMFQGDQHPLPWQSGWDDLQVLLCVVCLCRYHLTSLEFKIICEKHFLSRFFSFNTWRIFWKQNLIGVWFLLGCYRNI